MGKTNLSIMPDVAEQRLCQVTEIPATGALAADLIDGAPVIPKGGIDPFMGLLWVIHGVVA
ncbi:MAG TPA: hypothetical protein ENI75_02235 [Mizugakiibacter sp.]|nr:hypothetical protein [Mizugakiibacter sp.]